MADLSSFVALSLLPSWLNGRIRDQLRAGRSAASVLGAIIAEQWPDQPDRRSALEKRAAAALRRAASGGITAIVLADSSYPALLAAIVDPPPVLWVRGSLTPVDSPTVAIVGSRTGSVYALTVAERLACDLASRGVVVVSGLSRGVDSAAHRGALNAPGPTVGVLGSGVDVIYPPEHEDLARSIEATGAVLSEFAPGTPPQPWCFPRRNRIISGLSRAVVVIEAGARSGSLITARLALEQGRDVLAVPGNVLNGRNSGAHGLLRDGAKIVETADDILEELGVAVQHPHRARSGVLAKDDPVLNCLDQGESCDLDVLAERTGLPPARLLSRLLDLELQGLVRRVGGGRFTRVDRPC